MTTINYIIFSVSMILLGYSLYMLYHLGREHQREKSEAEALSEANKVNIKGAKNGKEIDKRTRLDLINDRKQLRSYLDRFKGDKTE